jgi:uncharacterized protein with NRDE domain
MERMPAARYKARVCTLALFLHQSARRPLVIAANRDEFLARPATEPMQVEDEPWIVAGIDLVAGGTWLGTNESGLTVGLLNRRTSLPIDPSRESRGALCLDALRCRSLAEARELVGGRRGDAYNPFNLLVAAPAGAFVAQNHGPEMALTDLRRGLHLLTNLDLNDATCPRIAKSHRLFEAALPYLDHADPAPLVTHLRAVLSDHSTPLDPRGSGAIENLCVHLGEYGTRSSSIILYCDDPPRRLYFHAPGPPCVTEYTRLQLPL